MSKPPPTPPNDELIPKVLRGVRSVLREVIDTVEDPARRTALLNDLGQIPPTSPVDVTAQISSSRHALDGTSKLDTDDITMDGLASIAQALVATSLAVRDLIRAASGGPPGSKLDVLYDAFNLLSTTVVRNRYPSAWAFARIWGLADAHAWRMGQVSLLVGGDIKTFFAGLWNGRETTHTADVYATVIGALPIALDAYLRSRGATNWIQGDDDTKHHRMEVRYAFGWEQASRSSHPNADEVLNRATSVEVVLVQAVEDPKTGTQLTQETLRLTLIPVPAVHGGPALFLQLTGTIDLRIPLAKSSGWQFRLASNLPSASVAIPIGGDAKLAVQGGPPDYAFVFGLERPDDDKGKWTLGNQHGVYLEIGKAALLASVGFAGAKIVWSQSDSALVIKSTDSWLKSLLSSEGLRLEMDVGLTLDTRPSLTLDGGVGLKATLPVNKSVFGIEVQSITIALTSANQGGVATASLEVSGSFDVSIASRAAVITVQRVGLALDFTHDPAQPGGAGPLGDFSLRPKSPTGLGIAIDVGDVVSGGGFLSFDTSTGDYSGVLEINVHVHGWRGWDIKVIGIFGTKLPDGSPGTSFLGIGTVEWTPPVPLFWGSRLTGLGFLLGLNHTVSVDEIQKAVHNKALDSILFPSNPIAHAARIVQTLHDVFPVAGGHHLYGIVAKIDWAEGLASISLGVIVQLPEGRAAVLGSLQMIFPRKTRDSDVVIRIDFTGEIDPPGKFVRFDGALVNSYIGRSQLSGDLAFEYDWTSPKVFIFSAGGFHPRFHPPQHFALLKRIRVDLSHAANPRLRADAYFAVTSNSVQFGGAIDLYAAAAGFELVGNASLDMIFAWEPFSFEADVHVGAALKAGGSTIAGVTFNGTFAGTRPYSIHGDVSLELLFWSIDIPFNYEWGSLDTGQIVTTINAFQQAQQSLSDPGNWAADFPASSSQAVTLLRRETPGAVLAHPLGVLRAEQRILPLGVQLDHIGEAKIEGDSTISISNAALAGATASASPTEDMFAAGMYKELTQDEKVTRPAFEPMQSGIRFSNEAFSASSAVMTDLTYETFFISTPQPSPGPRNAPPAGDAATTLLKMVASSGAGKAERNRNTWTGLSQPVTVRGPWLVVAARTADLGLAPNPNLATVQTYTLARQALDAHVAANPGDAETYQLVAPHEAIHA